MLGEVDYGFCLGDLSRFGRGLQESIEVLDVGKPLYLLPGNMDPAGEVERACRERPNLHYFHGCSIQLGDHTLAGMGGGVITSFHTPFELTDGEARRLLEGFRGLKRLILLTHCPAHGTALDLALSGITSAPAPSAGSSLRKGLWPPTRVTSMRMRGKPTNWGPPCSTP